MLDFFIPKCSEKSWKWKLYAKKFKFLNWQKKNKIAPYIVLQCLYLQTTRGEINPIHFTMSLFKNTFNKKIYSIAYIILYLVNFLGRITVMKFSNTSFDLLTRWWGEIGNSEKNSASTLQLLYNNNHVIGNKFKIHRDINLSFLCFRFRTLCSIAKKMLLVPKAPLSTLFPLSFMWKFISPKICFRMNFVSKWYMSPFSTAILLNHEALLYTYSFLLQQQYHKQLLYTLTRIQPQHRVNILRNLL